MAITNITKTAIEALEGQTGRQILLYDKRLSGFGYRTGGKGGSYFCEGKVRGRTVRITIGRADRLSPEAARKLAMLHLAAMAQGVDPREEKKAIAARSMTLREVFEALLAAKPHLASVTVDGYRRTFRLYLGAWSNKPVGEITRAMVQAAHQRISREHGPITANNSLRHFRLTYNFAAATIGDLPPNPVAVISQARAWAPERRRRGYIPPHAMPAWYAAVLTQEARIRDLFLATLFTGLRKGEVCALRWDGIDLKNRTLTIPRTKNGDPLVLPLSGFLTDLLTARRAADSDGEWVFPSCGRCGHITILKGASDRVSKASGVQFSPHDLRRTFITIAESLDIPHYALKRLLNHRLNGDVTEGYIVVTPERLRGPVEKIANHILELMHGRPVENTEAA